MNPIAVDAISLIAILKEQRNVALDDVAMMRARIVDLERENAALRERLPPEQKDPPA